MYVYGIEEGSRPATLLFERACRPNDQNVAKS